MAIPMVSEPLGGCRAQNINFLVWAAVRNVCIKQEVPAKGQFLSGLKVTCSWAWCLKVTQHVLPSVLASFTLTRQ